MFFKSKKYDEVDKFMHINNEKQYILSKIDLTLKIQSKNQKKNIVMFKNMKTFINYKKYETILLRFENDEDLIKVIWYIYYKITF